MTPSLGNTFVDAYLFAHYKNASGWRVLSQTEWYDEVYDVYLLKYLNRDANVALSLKADNTAEGPSITATCIWDEYKTLKSATNAARRTYATPATLFANTAARKNYMGKWYFDILKLRYTQTFSGSATFTAGEKTLLNKLLRQVEDLDASTDG